MFDYVSTARPPRSALAMPEEELSELLLQFGATEFVATAAPPPLSSSAPSASSASSAAAFAAPLPVAEPASAAAAAVEVETIVESRTLGGGGAAESVCGGGHETAATPAPARKPRGLALLRSKAKQVAETKSAEIRSAKDSLELLRRKPGDSSNSHNPHFPVDSFWSETSNWKNLRD